MTRKKSAGMPVSAMQWQARKIATQAAKLADQAAPMTKKAAVTARRRAGGAADWAMPRIGRARAWMAVRAAKGSVSVQETVAPRVSAMLAATARKLDPPKPQSRRWPKVLAGTAMLAAAGAAAAAMVMRSRPGTTAPLPPRPSASDNTDPSVKVVRPGAEQQRGQDGAELSGTSSTR